MTLKKLIKHILLTFFIFFGLFLTAAILVPIYYKQEILSLVKKEIDNNIDARVNFKDVRLSLFRHFPHLSVRIENICVIGNNAFKKDTLFSAPDIDISLDLVKAVKGNYDILKIDFIKPRVCAVVDQKGVANWNIVKPTPAAPVNSAPAKHFSVKLRKYSIEHAYIVYRDEQQKMYATLENFSHEGTGDFKNDNFTLKTKTNADAITIISGKIPYLHRVQANMDFDLEVNNKTSEYSFDTKNIQLNGLHVSAKGVVRMQDTLNTFMDIQFNTPSNDFKDILSLVPGIYQKSFSDVKTTGSATLQGNIKGVYNKKQIPTFNLDLAIDNGSFQYPDLPQKVTDIQVKLNVHNPDGVIDHTVVNVEKGHVQLGPEPFDFHLCMKAPETSQWIEANAKGHIDLSQLKQFIKLDATTRLSGNINADVSIKGSLAAAEKKQLDSIDATGTISIENLEYASKDIPDVANINSMLLTFNPENVTVTNLKATFLETTFTGEGSIDNLLSYYLHNHTLTGSIHITGDKIDGNKWKKAFTEPKTPAPKTTDTSVFVAPSNLNISLNASVDEIIYDRVKIKNVQGLMVMGDEVINLKNVVAHALEGEVNIDGYYSTKTDKKIPEMNFEYIVSFGKLVVAHKHIKSENAKEL